MPLYVSTLIWNDLKKSSFASRDFTLVVMTESSTYSPVLSRVGVDAQAAKVAISIRSTKQWITIFFFFIAMTPLCKFDCETVDYETFSKYLTFSGKGPNRYNIFRP